MGQALGCCALCCTYLRGRKARASAAAAVSEEADDSKSKLLPSSASKARKTPGKKSSKHKRPPSHLRELAGDINQVVRLVLVGGCDTGKTCLLRRFLGGYFDEAGQQDYTRTLGVDFGCKTIELADRRVRLQMWDTGGSETYRSVVSHYLRGADGVIMCFDIKRKTTLRALRSIWAPFLDKHTQRSCRVLLAGNKADSRGDSRAEGTEVSPEDAKRFADAIEVQAFETSAKLGTNVDVAVLALMREVLHHRQFAAKEKSSLDANGSSPRRKGRKRLSVALRNVMESGSEGDAASCEGARGGKTHELDDTATEGTSSAASTSVSQGSGDSSDQSSNNVMTLGIQGRTWTPFPSTGDGADNSNFQRKGVGDGRSMTGGMRDGSAVARGGETMGRGGEESKGDDTKRRGRYHFINQLVIAAPSRVKNTNSADKIRHGSGCVGGSANIRITGGGARNVISRAQNPRGVSPGGLCRGGRISQRRMDDGRKTTFPPQPGAAANVPPTRARPRGPIAASRHEPSPPATDEPPSALDVDERQRLEGGSGTTSNGDAFRTAAESTEVSKSASACDVSLSRLSDAARLSVAMQQAATERKLPQQVQRQPQSTECNGEIDSGVNGGDGGPARVLARTSASSSSSTIVVGDGLVL